jgi:hypothetical protein
MASGQVGLAYCVGVVGEVDQGGLRVHAEGGGDPEVPLSRASHRGPRESFPRPFQLTDAIHAYGTVLRELRHAMRDELGELCLAV